MIASYRHPKYWLDPRQDTAFRRYLGLYPYVAIVGFVGVAISPAAAQTCAIANNQSSQPSTVSLNAGSCTIPSGQVLQAPGFFPPPGPQSIVATGGGVISGSNLTVFTTPSGGTAKPVVQASGPGSAIYLDVNSAGTITGSGSTFTTSSGGGSVFLEADTSGLIEASNINLNFPSGGQDTGALAQTNGSIVLLGGSMTLGSGSGQVLGLSATSGGSITANGTTINVGQSGNPVGGIDIGAQANGGSITLTNSTVNMFDQGSQNFGLQAIGASSTITTTNTNVVVEDPNNPPQVDLDTGVQAAGGALVNMTGGSVSVSGRGNGELGLQATGGGSVINASGVAISVPTGASGAGVQADTIGTVNLTNASTISTGGLNTPGGLLRTGGTINMTGGSVTTTGANSDGFAFTGGGAADTLNLTNVTVAATQGNSFDVNGSTANIALAGVTATVNNGTVLLTQGGGTTALNASGSTLAGVMTTTGGSTANVTLQNATTWTMTGNSNVTNLTNANSEIDYTAPTGDPTLLSSYKTLTANNYVGDNGTIDLNTYLGADGAPSDLVVINGGAATGTTILGITNTTGPGAETQANGIQVVSALNGATTAAGSFSLGGQEVRGGAFDYYLFQGGINGSVPQDWFLRSSFVVPQVPLTPVPPGTPPPEPPPPPTSPPETDLPPDPPPVGSLPPGTYPIIGPEIATYGAVQPIARELGLTILGTLHDRIGDTLLDESQPCADSGDVADKPILERRRPIDCAAGDRHPSTWVRVFGQSIDNSYRAFAAPSTTGQFLGFQAGLDLWRGSFAPGHRDAAGLYFSYANAYADVSGIVTNAAATGYIFEHTGTLNLNAWSAGGYWTHYGPTGWYLDAIVQGTRYDGSAGTQFASLETSGYGLIGSLEGGYPIALPVFGPGFVIEPQGQIIGQRVAFDSANDEFGEVALGTTDGVTGRLGLRGRWTFETSQGEEWQPYLRANFWRDWGGQATTVFSGVDQVPLAEAADRLQFGGGLTMRLNAAVSVYANTDYQFAVGDTGNGRREGVRGAAGVRYSW